MNNKACDNTALVICVLIPYKKRSNKNHTLTVQIKLNAHTLYQPKNPSVLSTRASTSTEPL